jgi:hypothetical protein
VVEVGFLRLCWCPKRLSLGSWREYIAASATPHALWLADTHALHAPSQRYPSLSRVNSNNWTCTQTKRPSTPQSKCMRVQSTRAGQYPTHVEPGCSMQLSQHLSMHVVLPPSLACSLAGPHVHVIIRPCLISGCKLWGITSCVTWGVVWDVQILIKKINYRIRQ